MQKVNEKVHLTEKELADRWHMNNKTLCNWRSQGKGPSFIKIGGVILYPLKVIKNIEKTSLKKRKSTDTIH